MYRRAMIAVSLLLIAVVASPAASASVISGARRAVCPRLQWRALRPAEVCCIAFMQCLDRDSIAEVALSALLRCPMADAPGLRCRSRSSLQEIVRCLGHRLSAKELPSWNRVPSSGSTGWADLPGGENLRHAAMAGPLCRHGTGGQSKGRQPCCARGQPCARKAAALTFFDARCGPEMRPYENQLPRFVPTWIGFMSMHDQPLRGAEPCGTVNGKPL